MSTEPLLCFEPSELNFPFELNKQLASSIRLLNKTAHHVAFKLLTTNPKYYGVRPRIGILLPGAVCDISVTKRAVREAPQSMRCKDKFMIQSALASANTTLEDVRKMFNKEAGDVYQESKLRVVYIKPPESSSVAESPRSEVSSPITQPHENVLQMATRKHLDIKPPELQFPISPSEELSCSIQLSNVTENHIAFRVKTASSKYFVQPNIGILLPHSTCDITVRMQALSKIQSDILCGDKVRIQSVVATAAATTEDIILDMFDKARSTIEECELQVSYIWKQEKNCHHVDELFLRGIIMTLLVLGLCYLMKRTSLMWSLTMVAIMLMIKMVKKLVSDSVEDWVVKTLIYIVMHFVFRRTDNIVSS